MSEIILKKVYIKILFRLVVLVFIFFFVYPNLLLAGKKTCFKSGYISNFKNGSINWSTGCITARGTAAPQKENKGKLSSTIPGAAKADAMKNLILILKNIKISHTIVKDYIASNDDIMAQLENSIFDAKVVKQHYTSDGALEIEVQTSMYGGFLQLILPHDIAHIPQIASIENKDTIIKQRGKFTGLVLDARGLKFKPLLYPVIKNEYGDEIYSAVFINREYAVQNGVCRYFCDFKKALKDKRVGDNPLVLKGLRMGEDKSSIILSKLDAEKIEKIIERHSFFKECRVIIVID